MKKKHLLISLLVLAPLFLAACASQTTAPTAAPASNTPAVSASDTQVTAPAATPAALAEVAKHNSATDCWMIIDGQTYNVTPYVQSGMHPGGNKILNGCGQDASAMFHSVGKHSSPQSQANLQKYLVK